MGSKSFAILSRGNICGIELELAEVLFYSVSFEKFSLGYSVPSFSSF